MTSPDPRELRHTFETVAREYDRTRPGYPPALFDDLAELAGLRSGSRVLEIGCGTGQATRALAERGYSVVAIELGAELAALARRKLAAFPKVEIEVAAFEGWPLPAEPFDAVIAATAFHWIEPAVRVRKAAEALRHGGALAIIETHHVAGGTRSFFADVQRCYQRSGPAGGTFQLPDTAEIAMDSSELDSSGAFEPAVFRRHEWEREYT
ncbi:MAG: class I SAM-dependent methyltransferase, partial [Chloroflexi bacterium]|nr:class I SAM-dependent methyltransferase [Chloroflexota bacterium]